MNLFKGKEKVIIIEVPYAQPFEGYTAEEEAAIIGLEHNIGMQALLRKHAFQRAALMSKLQGEEHKSLSRVHFLQAGTYWADWLRREIATTKERKLAKDSQRPLEPTEEEILDQLKQAISIVGADE